MFDKVYASRRIYVEITEGPSLALNLSDHDWMGIFLQRNPTDELRKFKDTLVHNVAWHNVDAILKNYRVTS